MTASDAGWQPGQVVHSVAGHDSRRFYMVVRAGAQDVWIADGKRRKLDKPKRKNIRHVRKTLTVLDPAGVTTDKQLRAALRPFNGPKAAPEKEGGS